MIFIAVYIHLHNYMHTCTCLCRQLDLLIIHAIFLLLLGDPVEFMSWLLNTLHYALCAGKRKSRSSIVHETFQGEMKIYTRKLPPQTEVMQSLLL